MVYRPFGSVDHADRGYDRVFALHPHFGDFDLLTSDVDAEYAIELFGHRMEDLLTGLRTYLITGLPAVSTTVAPSMRRRKDAATTAICSLALTKWSGTYSSRP